MPPNPDPAIFRAVVSTIVPEAAALDDQGWHDLHQVIDALLRDRPESLKRQLRIFLRAIQWLPVIRYGRPFIDACPRGPLIVPRRGLPASRSEPGNCASN